MNVTLNRTAEILLVEDNLGAVRLTQEALKESRIKNNLSIVDNGDEALKYLRKQHPYHEAILPDLIMLDLNLPKRNGLQVLKEVKDDDLLKHIPVVILTTSKAEQDISACYRSHANCYITKPVDLRKFIQVIKIINHFWFSIVKLPSE